MKITNDCQPLVTVAMSVYNVEKFVDQAIKSIFQQTYRNIDFLIIDDASSDKTYEIAEYRAKEDCRIRLLKQPKNMGLSASRNLAIREAKGKYIIMLDGDDLFDPRMIETAVGKAEKNNAEMVMWDYHVFRNDDEVFNIPNNPNPLYETSQLGLPKKRHALVKRPGFMWTRMLKLEALRALRIEFPLGLTKQDIPVHWQLVTQLNKIEIIPQKLAFYRIQPNATSCRKGESLFALAEVMDITFDFLQYHKLYDEYYLEFWVQRLSLLHGMYDFIRPDLKSKALEIINHHFRDPEMDLFLQNHKDSLSFRTRHFYGMLKGRAVDTFLYRFVISLRSVYRTVRKFVP